MNSLQNQSRKAELIVYLMKRAAALFSTQRVTNYEIEVRTKAFDVDKNECGRGITLSRISRSRP